MAEPTVEQLLQAAYERGQRLVHIANLGRHLQGVQWPAS